MMDLLLVDRKQPPGFRYQIVNAFPNAKERDLGKHSGDILIQCGEKLILIEVKEVPNDFLASITDARLFRQMEGMREITPWSFLLLSNDFEYSTSNQVMGMGALGYGPIGTWNRDHVEGALTSVQFRGGIIRVAYNGYIDAIRRITHLVENADKGAVTSEPIKLSPFDKDDQQTVNLLAWFDGIGVTQAKNFLQWANKDGQRTRKEILELALTPFKGDDKPVGWTNNTIERNRKKMGLPETVKPKRTEWVEEIDL